MRHRPLALPVLALGLALVGGPVDAAGTNRPHLTSPVQATIEDQAPTRTYASPYLLVDPTDSRNVVASTVDMRTRTCRLLRSTDSGQTWKLLEPLPSPPSYPFCFNTSGMQTETPMAWGHGHTLYLAMNGWDNQDGGQRGNISVLLARSTDLGDTWQTTIVRNNRGRADAALETDTPVSSVAVDTHGREDVVYVAYRRALPNSPTPGLRPPMVAASTDGGRSFGEPVDVTSFYTPTAKDGATGNDVAIGMSFNAPQVAVDDKGTLFVMYPAGAVSTLNPPQPFPVLLARSTDQGRSFTFTEAAPPSVYTEHVVVMRWGKGGGPAGTLHAVYEDKPDQPPKGADRDIFYVRSTDGGKTFGKPVRLNDDDPTKLAVQATPNVSVAPGGRVDAVWWDFRDDPGRFANDVYYSYSDDNGASWSRNVRVTDRSVNRAVGVWSNGADIRQPPGVASTDRLAVMAWDDTRLADDTTQTQDVFSRVVQFQTLGGSSSAARYVLGAIGGLALVGLVLLVVGLWGRRGPRPAVPSPPGRRAAEVG